MVRIEGNFSIHPTDDGLFVARQEKNGSQDPPKWIFSDGKTADIVREVSDTLFSGNRQICPSPFLTLKCKDDPRYPEGLSIHLK